MQGRKANSCDLPNKTGAQAPVFVFGAEGGSRTHTSLHSLRPERSASANSATSAKEGNFNVKAIDVNQSWVKSAVLNYNLADSNPL